MYINVLSESWCNKVSFHCNIFAGRGTKETKQSDCFPTINKGKLVWFRGKYHRNNRRKKRWFWRMLIGEKWIFEGSEELGVKWVFIIFVKAVKITFDVQSFQIVYPLDSWRYRFNCKLEIVKEIFFCSQTIIGCVSRRVVSSTVSLFPSALVSFTRERNLERQFG